MNKTFQDKWKSHWRCMPYTRNWGLKFSLWCIFVQHTYYDYGHFMADLYVRWRTAILSKESADFCDCREDMVPWKISPQLILAVHFKAKYRVVFLPATAPLRLTVVPSAVASARCRGARRRRWRKHGFWPYERPTATISIALCRQNSTAPRTVRPTRIII